MGKFKVGDILRPKFEFRRDLFLVKEVRPESYVLARIFPTTWPSHFSETEYTEKNFNRIKHEENILAKVLYG